MARGRTTDVIEVSDSDSDASDRRAASKAPTRRRSSTSKAANNDASTYMRRPSEWAFLESSDDDANANDSDDFERPTRSKKPSPKKTKATTKAKAKAKATSASSTPVKQSKKPTPTKRPYDDDDDEEDEEIDMRPRRVVTRHLFSDHLTMSELQAQEREMARLRALNKSHAASNDQHAYSSSSRKASTTTTTTTTTTTSAARPSSSNGKAVVAPAPKRPVGRPPSSSSKKPASVAPSVGIGRTVLATTLARKQHAREHTQPPSPAVKKKKANTDTRHGKRRRAESSDDEQEDEEDEEEEEAEDEESDDFVDDIVEAKMAALRASLELAKKKSKASRLGIKTVVATPSPPPSPPSSPPSSPPRRSATSTKSKTAKKAPPPPSRTTPPRKSSGKAKQPERKQPRVVPPPPVELPRESRRKNGQGLLSEWLSVSELQAQEREWSRLQRDLKHHEPSSPVSQPPPKSKAKTKEKPTPSRNDRPSRSSRRQRSDSESSDVSLVEIVELMEDDEEEDTKDDDDFVPAVPAPRKKSTNSKKPNQSKKKPSATSKSSTPAAPRPPAHSSSIATSKPTDVLSKPRTAAETVPHGTIWRAVTFKSAPANLLSLPSSLAPPFALSNERPLVEFDTDGDLEMKCRILPSFGKTKSFLLANDPNKPEVSQDSMNERVMELLEAWMPRIKSCYERKCDAIVREARDKTEEYVRAREETIRAIVERTGRFDSQQQVEKIPVCAAERSLAQQLLIGKEVPPLNVVGTIKVGRGETFLVEKEVVPHKAIELVPVRQISRSTTFVGVKTSVRVEDDPILRYVPYFGDNDNGDAIDVKAYDSVRAKEAAEGAKSSNGLDNEAHEYMLRVVIAEYGDLETVFNALKQVAGFAQPYTEYCEIKKRLDARLAASKRMQEIREYMASLKKGDMEDDEKTRVALEELTKGLYPFADPARASMPLSERFASQWTYFDTNLLPSQSRGTKGFRRLLGLRHTNDYADLSETYRDLFCRMCYKYDCPDHGIEHPMPTRRVDPLYPLTRFSPLVAKETKQAKEEAAEVKFSKTDEAAPELEDGDQVSASTSTAEMAEVVSQEDGDGVDATQATDITDLASECSVSTAESQETIDLSLAEPRRSSRSGTRASSLALVSIESQLVAQGFKSRTLRTQRSKAPQKRAGGDQSEYLDDSHQALVSSKVKKFLKAGEICSESCWKAEGASEEAKSAGGDDFTEPEEEIKARLNAAELLVLQKLRYTVGDNACMIASVLQSLSCRDVHTYLVSQQRSKPTDQQGYFSPDVSGKKNRKRGRAAAALPGNNRELLKRTRHQRLKDTSSANHDYEPCNHEGICDFGASCSCMKRDHMCEKACSCSRDCPNRFQGCKCSMGNCRTNQCPCFVALRECNPDLCHSCGASDVPVLVYNPEFKAVSSQELGICCNVNVQRGLHKRLGASYSRTHGWGAFALEPIKKGEFIYEYTGAIISHDEAERRGSIYDKLNISFLFDLNEDSVADAVRTGNKSKFCNHAAVGQKCHARIFRVGGEHHISIWALADIRKGEELFFNYGYHGESAPVWSQGARITESSKREAEEAEEVEEDASDDGEPEIVTIE